MHDPFYRYFLGFRPDPSARDALAAVAQGIGQRSRPQLLHFTLCVIAEVGKPDPFGAARVEAALAGHALSSLPIRLGRVHAGDHGALVRTIGRQEDIQSFYQTLVNLLAARGIAPLHRQTGLHPHVTLGHEPCQFDPFDIAVEWFPQELLLIESEVGNSRHQIVGRWPLLPPAQGILVFEPSLHRSLIDCTPANRLPRLGNMLRPIAV